MTCIICDHEISDDEVAVQDPEGPICVACMPGDPDDALIIFDDEWD